MRRRTLLLAGALASVPLAGKAQTPTKMTIATGVDPAFSQFYVAKEGGLFEKNGLDVTINTGPSGSAMIPFLVNNQVQAAYGSDLAGVVNHQVDPNIVAVADGTYLVKWLNREIRFARKNASVCSGDGLTAPTNVVLPTQSQLKNPSDSSSDVYLGTQPTVTGAPRVIQGDVKY